MITFEVDGCRFTCRPESVPRIMDRLTKCHRKPRRNGNGPRTFPRFVPGMSVAAYAAQYWLINGLHFKPCNPLSDAPQWPLIEETEA